METNRDTRRTGQKIDFYTILKRRKRTAKFYVLDQLKVNSQKDLLAALKELEKEYVVSDDFKKDCLDVIKKEEATTVVKAPVVEKEPASPKRTPTKKTKI